MSRIIHPLKKTLLQFPGLWLPSSPFPGALGMGGYPCCCDAAIPCNHCTTTSSQFQIVVPLHANRVPGCATCDEYSGTFVLTQNPISACQWTYAYEDNKPCGLNATIILQISTLLGPNTKVSVLWSGYGISLWYEDTDVGSDDCGNWSDVPIPFKYGATDKCVMNPDDLLLSAV